MPGVVRFPSWMLAVVALAAAAFPVRADEQFSDGTFNDSDCTSPKIADTTSGTVTFSANRVASGGNADLLRRVTHEFQFDYAAPRSCG